MIKLIVKLVGFALLIAGIYFLGQNIFFASSIYQFWRSIPAAGSVLCVMGGVLCLLFFRQETDNLGWILLILGIILVFLSGGVFLRPTSLWQFLMAFMSLSLGYKLFTSGRVSF
jgi:uncharacterized membrane protein HdeD (DUF308 family)